MHVWWRDGRRITTSSRAQQATNKFDRRKYNNTTTPQKCERRENRVRLDHRLDDIMDDNNNDNVVHRCVLTYPFTSYQIILTIMMMRIIVLVNLATISSEVYHSIYCNNNNI
jgi:hypothetical protein